MALQVETSNAEPHADMYITPQYAPKLPLVQEDTPMANRHNEACLYITHPRGIHRCLVFDLHLKFSQDFRLSKPKRSKRLKLCLPPATRTHKRVHRRRAIAKIEIN